MGATKKIRKVMVDKSMTQVRLAELLGKPYMTVRNTLIKDNMKMETLEEYADALGCDVALIDRETGEVYR